MGFLNECVSFGGTVFIIGEMGVSDRYACFKTPECAEQPLVSIGNAATYQITLITVVLDRGERSGSTEIVLGEMGLHPEKLPMNVSLSHQRYSDWIRMCFIFCFLPDSRDYS